MRRRIVSAAVAAVLVVVGCMVVATPPAGAREPSLEAFRRLGAWVDVFDYAPRLQKPGTQPRVTPDSVSDMAALGVKTLYLQVANPDGAPADRLTDRTVLQPLLDRARERGIAVVPWFLPSLTAPADDVATMRRIVALRAGGRPLAGVALDLESSDVPDIALRNKRTVAFAAQVRTLVGASTPIAAIVYPAVQLEVLNTALWPEFPYKGLARSVDLWMPMSYYTFRSTESGLRSAFRYTVDSVDRLRARVDDPKAPVHVIGGLAEASTPDDYLDLARAARATDALGWSVYDYTTTGSWAWPYLRAEVPIPTTSVAPTTAAPTTSASTTTAPASTSTTPGSTSTTKAPTTATPSP